MTCLVEILQELWQQDTHRGPLGPSGMSILIGQVTLAILLLDSAISNRFACPFCPMGLREN